MRESLKSKKQRISQIYPILETLYPDVSTFLTHDTPFQLLIAVILSAQCTDERVNLVTPRLFQKFPTPEALATANPDEVVKTIKSINFFNNKAHNIQKTAQIIHTDYRDEVPRTLSNLIQLPGVGRKTANVVLGQAFNIPGITVDTHIKRVTRRLGFTKESDPVKIEYDLMKVWPENWWNMLSTTLILHGRTTCPARKPRCEACQLAAFCPTAAKASKG